MSKSKADILLHPVRMQIIQTLLTENLTVQQMKEQLLEIPQATLYRHLKKLLEAGVVYVIDEQPVRGTIEKVYSLQPKQASISANDLSTYTREDYMSLFMKYMANLMAEYERYISQDHIDFERDGVSLRQTTLHLTDDEFKSMLQELGQVYTKYSQNKSTSGYKSRTFANIIIPGTIKKEVHGDE